MQGLQFLINTLFTLYLMVVLMRLWMQLVRADFYNPLSQFVVKATNPLLLPMRRFIPAIGKLDTASLVLAYLVPFVKFLILQLLVLGGISISATLIMAGMSLIKEIVTLLFFTLIIRAIMSWFSQGRNPVEYLLQQLTEPVLRPIRRVIPPIAGLDLSILIVLLFIQFLNYQFGYLFRGV